MSLTTFWVYSVGDATMLTNAFVGVAMVFNNGDDIKSIVGMGLMFSLIMLGIRAVATQRFDLEYFFYGFILYMALFVPKVEVHVEDTYTATGTNVANVPLGIAIPMSIVTRLGHYFTVTYETAFSVPSMSEKGYLDALNIIARLDGIGTGSANSDSTISGDVRATIVNYISQCAIYDANNPSDEQEVTWEKIRKAENTWAALETNFVSRFVDMYLPGDPPAGSPRNCKDAYTAITLYLNGPFVSDWDNHLKYALKKQDPVSAVEDAMSALGTFSISAQEFMMNALVRTLVKEGSNTYTASNAQTGAAAIRTQAMEQRKYQWATEQSMFKEVARPLMAFIESFVVCLAPIMCFLITIGPMGIQLAGKYFLSVVWVSLWGPVMSLVNTYIHLAAAKDVADYTFTGADPATMMGMESLYTTIGTWVSTGGLLAASVPALTLTLVYGGAVTASALASRMQGSDHINEKIARPDLASNSAVMSVAGSHSVSPHLGGLNTGVEKGLDVFRTGASLQAGMSSVRGLMTSASTTLQKSLGRELGAGIQKLHSDSNLSSLMSSAESSMQQQHVQQIQTAKSTLKSLGIDQTLVDTAAAKAGVGAGLGLKAFGMGLETHMGRDVMKNMTAGERAQATEAWNKLTSATDSAASSYRQALSSQQGRTITDAVTSNLSDSQKQMLAKTNTFLSTASEQLQAMETFSKNAGISGDRDAQVWASQVIGRGKGQQVIDMAEAAGLGDRQRELAAMYRSKAYGMDERRANIAAAGTALLNAGMAGNGDALEKFNSITMEISGAGQQIKGLHKQFAEGEYAKTLESVKAETGQVPAAIAGVEPATNKASKVKMPDSKNLGSVPTGVQPLSKASRLVNDGELNEPAAPASLKTDEQRSLLEQGQTRVKELSFDDKMLENGLQTGTQQVMSNAAAGAVYAYRGKTDAIDKGVSNTFNVLEKEHGYSFSPEFKDNVAGLANGIVDGGLLGVGRHAVAKAGANAKMNSQIKGFLQKNSTGSVPPATTAASTAPSAGSQVPALLRPTP